ncbi:hypothetical protein BDB00DRAFT_855630 [Zychaea mexicana]|uniref:uncharacterized protein n=1 Tax=Zychaea mexicana TaxID=64656 RepID=UPI0022FEE6D2|nr:uncharacterized protein BDB00DRAFT_855630 [Zychaea mexicana]KAI9484424.1 hypothetical protein BDB00DRAFT_855630 [Zychaea mexicana]
MMQPELPYFPDRAISASAPTSPTRTLLHSPPDDSKRRSLKYIFAPLSQRAPQTSTPSTNKIILDYLLYLSIQSRLKQAHVELMELATPLPDSGNTDSLEARKKRWMETASKAEQDKHAVEAIVAGILSAGSQIKGPSFIRDDDFEQRLHLCQLTNLVFGRFDATSTGQHVIAHNSARRRRHEAQLMAMVMENADVDGAEAADDNVDDDANKENLDDFITRKRQQLFSKAILPSYCRRHRRQNCYGCAITTNSSSTTIATQTSTTTPTNPSSSNASSSPSKTIPPAGLIEAIPVFLKTSADMLRRTLETTSGSDGDESHQEEETRPMIFAGQRVMGGGMPPRWYDLFLSLLSQAAIECYMCDGQAGLESIFEIFSYGDVEDEDEPEDADDEDENDDEEQQQQDNDEWGVRAADHHLLFPKTRTMYLFKTQVREREKEVSSLSLSLCPNRGGTLVSLTQNGQFRNDSMISPPSKFFPCLVLAR